MRSISPTNIDPNKPIEESTTPAIEIPFFAVFFIPIIPKIKPTMNIAPEIIGINHTTKSPMIDNINEIIP